MKRNRLLRSALALVVIAGLVAALACGDDSDNGDTTSGSSGGNGEFTDEFTPLPGVTETAGYPIVVDRSDGQRLTIEQAPRRVVSLSPGATEIIYAIGAEAALVAVDNQADYPPAAASFPTKVDAYEPNVEAIAALEPDLVIVPDNGSGIVEALDRLGIPVLYQDLDTDVLTVQSVLGQIALFGQVFDRRDAANELVADLSERISAIKNALRQVDSATVAPKVYHELDSTFFTASTASFIGDVYNTLRVRNIAGDGGGQAYPQLTQEAIISANPDVIVLADEEFGVTIESVKQRPGWDAIAAVQNNRIYSIDPDIISRPGPRIVDALEQLARAIYPDKFS